MADLQLDEKMPRLINMTMTIDTYGRFMYEYITDGAVPGREGCQCEVTVDRATSILHGYLHTTPDVKYKYTSLEEFTELREQVAAITGRPFKQEKKKRRKRKIVL